MTTETRGKRIISHKGKITYLPIYFIMLFQNDPMNARDCLIWICPPANIFYNKIPRRTTQTSAIRRGFLYIASATMYRMIWMCPSEMRFCRVNSRVRTGVIYFVNWIYGEKVLDLKNQADVQEIKKPSCDSCKNARAEGCWIWYGLIFHFERWIKSEFSLQPIESRENMSII